MHESIHLLIHFFIFSGYILTDLEFPTSHLMVAKEFLTDIRQTFKDGRRCLEKMSLKMKPWPESKEWLLELDRHEKINMRAIFTAESKSVREGEQTSCYSNVVKGAVVHEISSSDRFENLLEKCSNTFVIIIATESDGKLIADVLANCGRKIHSFSIVLGGSGDARAYRYPQSGITCMVTNNGSNSVEFVLRRELLLAVKPLIDVLLYCHMQIVKNKNVCCSQLAIQSLQKFEEHLSLLSSGKVV